MELRYKKVLGAIIFSLSLLSITTNLQAQTVLEVLKTNDQTSAFAEAIEKTGLTDRLSQDGPYTLFVPANKAFNKLSVDEQNNSSLLLNHIITGKATKRSLKHISNMTCLSGITIEVVEMNNNSLSVQNYPLISSNIRADNGIIHIIGGVIQ
ncbi:fasciclin domain-containing protein [Fodinibius salsisoli]|uniref:Fasciclin domain-containing protein n=1 Tax=Fodinibius salsisoli TaxID=2820877 RepID=A0ABT3PJU2_9BACT|nr:fasciclin domain-containing protein [Fodinibius salsisoli]MCW9706204.1 fasciclin domain-containing protein [Fodinibius salsisoli]